MGLSRVIKRETVINALTSQAAAGSTVVGTIESIDGVPILAFDEIRAELEVTTALTGTGPGMEIHLVRLRAGKTNPNSTTVADWSGLATFDQTTPATGPLEHVLPRSPEVAAGEIAAAQADPDAMPAAGAARGGHWGDVLGVIEEIAGTGLTAGVYSLHLTGIIHDGN